MFIFAYGRRFCVRDGAKDNGPRVHIIFLFFRFWYFFFFAHFIRQKYSIKPEFRFEQYFCAFRLCLLLCFVSFFHFGFSAAWHKLWLVRLFGFSTADGRTNQAKRLTTWPCNRNAPSTILMDWMQLNRPFLFLSTKPDILGIWMRCRHKLHPHVATNWIPGRHRQSAFIFLIRRICFSAWKRKKNVFCVWCGLTWCLIIIGFRFFRSLRKGISIYRYLNVIGIPSQNGNTGWSCPYWFWQE